MDKNYKAIATIKADDNQDGEVITIGIEKYLHDDGNHYYDLVADNGKEVTQGGRMSEKEATQAVYDVWGQWDTFEYVEPDEKEEIEKSTCEQFIENITLDKTWRNKKDERNIDVNVDEILDSPLFVYEILENEKALTTDENGNQCIITDYKLMKKQKFNTICE